MELNILLVFLAGMAIFLSPCIIPLVPSYLSYIGGVVEEGRRSKALLNTILFILGFGSAFSTLQLIISKFTNLAKSIFGSGEVYLFLGSIIIVMGLNKLGIFKWMGFQKERRIHLHFIKRNLITSYILGFAFGFGWTPCMGPVLFTVISYLTSSSSLANGLLYIWVFTLGLGFPFILYSIFIDSIDHSIAKKFILPDKLGGVILVIFGVILAMNKLAIFNNLQF